MFCARRRTVDACRDLPDPLKAYSLKDKSDALILRGGNSSIAPNGSYIVEHGFDDERIIT